MTEWLTHKNVLNSNFLISAIPWTSRCIFNSKTLHVKLWFLTLQLVNGDEPPYLHPGLNFMSVEDGHSCWCQKIYSLQISYLLLEWKVGPRVCSGLWTTPMLLAPASATVSSIWQRVTAEKGVSLYKSFFLDTTGSFLNSKDPSMFIFKKAAFAY